MIKCFAVGVILWLASSTVFAQLTPEQTAARTKGLALYQQSDWYDSQPLLKIAAEAGDSTAQYYLGEAIRLSKRYTTPEARRWYEASAKQGDLFAMLRLGDSGDLCHTFGTCVEGGLAWRDKALSLAYERAEKGDTEAMRVLYHAEEGLAWLEKAADAGDTDAQQLLGSFYKAGGGWFLTTGNRNKAVERYFRASAEGGNPVGMMLYANYLFENDGSKKEIRHWVKTAAEAGYIDAVSTYASNIAHFPNDLDFPENLVAGYGLTYLLSQLQGGGVAPEDGRRNLPELAKRMTLAQIKEAEVFAEEWTKAHPPLSYFVPVYGH
ncbi:MULTISPECIES: tetratricopeptide repeat protein [Pseudomonas]|uniref:tetratricopeptide repeat protein n=1 Tax=Pseudomonadaceae TaxID=135621 RepID=UPI00106E431E|nr:MULTISPECIES: tetratricopeptide repeat protein [Pseudomonas]